MINFICDIPKGHLLRNNGPLAKTRDFSPCGASDRLTAGPAQAATKLVSSNLSTSVQYMERANLNWELAKFEKKFEKPGRQHQEPWSTNRV